jgi:hypothetical protein
MRFRSVLLLVVALPSIGVAIAADQRLNIGPSLLSDKTTATHFEAGQLCRLCFNSHADMTETPMIESSGSV